MSAEFYLAITSLLENECGERPLLAVGGGFSDRSDDIGRGTVYGLSAVIRAREGFTPTDFGIKDFTDDELKKTTIEAAKAMWQRVWNRYNYGLLQHQDCATKLFDAAANINPYFAARAAQQACCALGAVIDVDGIFGVHTAIAIDGEDPQLWLQAMCSAQLQRYKDIVAERPDQRWNYDHLWVYRAAWTPK